MNRLYISALILTFLIVGCSDNQPDNVDPTMATIGFSTQNIEFDKVAPTRAIISEGTDLQVLAFQRSSVSTEADVTKTPFRQSKYKVDGAGKLVAVSQEMSLNRGATYDFYVYSTDKAFQSGTVNVAGMSHSEHFMVGKKIGVELKAEESSKSVDFGDLEHLVSREIILVRAASEYSNPTAPIPPTNVTSLVVKSVVQGKLATTPASFSLSTLKSGAAKLAPADELMGGALTFAETGFTTVEGSPLFESKATSFVIPATTAKLHLTFELEVNDKPYTFNAHDIDAPSGIFTKGYTYTFAMEIKETSISLKLFVGKDNPINGWEDVDWESEIGGGLGVVLGTWESISWDSEMGVASVFNMQPIAK